MNGLFKFISSVKDLCPDLFIFNNNVTTATWMDLETVILSEVRQRKRSISLICGI